MFDKIVALLIPVRSDTKYFHDYIMKAPTILFCKGRVNFLLNRQKPKNGSTFPSMVVIFHGNAKYYQQTIKSFEHKGKGGQHEFLLIATKGSPGTPEPENRPSSVIEAPRTEHSKKPLLYEMLEKMYPNRKYIELFARNTKDGWKSWGNEV